MTLTYKNRKGKTYYLHLGKTKTGKDKYFCSQKTDGVLLDAVPEGFEIYENPDGLVYLRREIKTLLSEDEFLLINRLMATKTTLKDYAYKVEHDKSAMTIFIADENPGKFLELLNPFLAQDENRVRDYAIKSGTFQAMLRFRLVDEEERLFVTERFCFRGSVDDWIQISGLGPLDTLAKKFVKHLGKESFFELMEEY